MAGGDARVPLVGRPGGTGARTRARGSSLAHVAPAPSGGKGAACGLHRPQRRHARRVGGEVVGSACEDGPVMRATARTATRAPSRRRRRGVRTPSPAVARRRRFKAIGVAVLIGGLAAIVLSN